jgi:phosphonoacetaldehyde hydrolase
MGRLKLVVFDWAGTTVDFGSLAPVEAFCHVFAERGMVVSRDEVRGPMGLAKDEHLRALLRLPALAARWRKVHGHAPTEADADHMYQRLVPIQLESAAARAGLIDGVREVVDQLRRAGIRIGATTGYFRTAAECVREAARTQGYEPDCSVCVEDVAAGRPAPYMIFRVMESLGIYPPSAVVKVGDTVPDIGEGLAAGVWSIGVLQGGSELGCDVAEWTALAHNERQARLRAARQKLLAAGAHAVIETLEELPALLAELEVRMSRGEKP